VLRDIDPSTQSPWLESLRRSRARRFAANRARRRGWTARSGLGALVASLAVAGGALAQSTTGGASVGSAPTPAPAPQAVTVAQIQSALGIPADGIAGPQTRRALKRFQRAHGIKVTGIADPATLAALGLDGSTSRTLASTSDPQSTLARIAQCESGGDPTVVSRDGRYRGKYQFSRATWRALGGTGDPAKADEGTQDAMAAKLLALRGTTPWPVCG
jgi:peptidoglycan hydrolase-like protein with peptidoglycan-binding domain